MCPETEAFVARLEKAIERIEPSAQASSAQASCAQEPEAPPAWALKTAAKILKWNCFEYLTEWQVRVATRSMAWAIAEAKRG
jgi:hypothetical protein